MKKTITTIFSLLACLCGLDAQISINSGSQYKVGQTFTIQACGTGNITLSNAGANVNVDFSNAVASGNPITTNLVAPSSTPYASSFPSSNVAYSAISSQGNNSYTYYNSTSSKLELLGVANSTITMQYADPQLLYNMPTNFNDTYSDKAACTYITNGVDGKRSVNSTVLADAYGNITIPAGTYPYLRLKTTQTVIDSFFISGLFVSASVQNFITYNYMNSNFISPLFNYSQNTTIQGTSVSAFYYISGSTGFNEKESVNSNVKIFPNPAKSKISIDLGSNMNELKTINIYDLAGKLTLSAQANQLQNNIFDLNIQELSSGLYTLEIESEFSSQRRFGKFIIE